jgi:O-antigen/teichoic acid export membrane protein
MSTPARLASGTGLSLGRLATAIVGQIVTVPVYLTHWDAQTFGVWLILQGMLGYLMLLSAAYQQYTYAEVLKCGIDARDAVRRIYWSSLSVAYVIALVEFGAILGFAPSVVSAAMSSGASDTSAMVVTVVVLYSLLNMIVMPFGAITAQTITIYGQYPRTAAWGLFDAVLIIFAPAVAVALGADLLTAGLVQVAAHATAAILAAIDLFRLARRFGLLAYQRIDWGMGMCNALYCLPLAGRIFIDSFRQQGFRILIGAYAGATAVTALATTRTFANVIQQGLTTITAPLMPELMRYVVTRDQERMEGAFAIVWLSIFALLVPGVLTLCLLAEPIFVFWTRGAVSFDPVLFLTLLATVLFFAAVQPAAAILQGQNRVALMISISVIAALALMLLSVLLIPPLGLRGAGFALLGAELCAATLTVACATRSLRQSCLDLPRRSFALVAAAVGSVYGLALLGVTVFAERPVFMALPFAVNALFASLYWATIPTMARTRILSVVSTIRSSLPVGLRAGTKFSD